MFPIILKWILWPDIVCFSARLSVGRLVCLSNRLLVQWELHFSLTSDLLSSVIEEQSNIKHEFDCIKLLLQLVWPIWFQKKFKIMAKNINLDKQAAIHFLGETCFWESWLSNFHTNYFDENPIVLMKYLSRTQKRETERDKHGFVFALKNEFFRLIITGWEIQPGMVQPMSGPVKGIFEQDRELYGSVRGVWGLPERS